MNKQVKSKSKTITILAQEYGVHTSTMHKWLKLAGLLKDKEKGRIYTPKEVQKIYEHLGCP